MAKLDGYMYLRQTIVTALLLFPFLLTAQFKLEISAVDRDSNFVSQTLRLQTNFRTQALAREYVNKLPTLLQSKGYTNASVDSAHFDSLQAFIQLYVGEPFKWAYLNTDSVDQKLLDAVNLNKKDFVGKSVDVKSYQSFQQKILDYLENNGYPFAMVRLDSIQIRNDSLYAHLKVNKGPAYKIDSIRNYGNGKISNSFLQRYLGIQNGSPYRLSRLKEISRKIDELPFLQEKQPWNITRLGTGSILNLYLENKKSSQVNVLVGFLPANQQLADQKLLVTGEANINLRNALGGGETIGLNWQQLQVKSPRLNIIFQQPYIFGSAFGVNFGFDLLKKDSSYVNINMLAGLQYVVASDQSGSIFVQNLRTNLLDVDTNHVKATRTLPPQIDMNSTSFGVAYEISKTNYRYNPRKGNELLMSFAVGTKTIKKNNVIVQLKDENDPNFDFSSLYDTLKLKSYQFRIRLAGAHYFQLNRASTLKFGLNGGWYQSPNTFRNELYQIGGYKLLRGFDEESIYCSEYLVGTLEYRYLIGRNSYLFTFIDMGMTGDDSQAKKVNNSYLGAGLGMAFETKAGIFNISLAAGKRDDSNFNLRQSKIHIGYVNFF
jgi:outer membrane protein assembly factor BamA